MQEEKFPNESVRQNKKKKRGNRTLTIIFYTLYCILILSFLAGLYYVSLRLEDTLVQYEESHITVRAEDTFQALFADPDWAGLYEMAGLEDTPFEGVDAFVSYMETATAGKVLSYQPVSQEDGHFDFQVLCEKDQIGVFRMTDRRHSGAKWPSWQLESLSLEVPRNITVQIRKLDTHTVIVNGIVLDVSHTIRIDSLLAEEYTRPGTDGIAMELQQVSGLLITPQILVLDEEGNPCPLVLDPETGIYEEQLPEASALTAAQTQAVTRAVNVWGAYKLQNAAGNLGVCFDPHENAYESILSGTFWVDAPGSYTVEAADILASQIYSEDHFSAYISFRVRLNDTDTVISKDATFFFQEHLGLWQCYELQPGNLYTDITKVRLEFRVNNSPIYYDFYESDRTAFYAPVVTVPEGCTFASWGTEDGQILYTPDENGFVALPQGAVLEPTVLHAIYETTEGGT